MPVPKNSNPPSSIAAMTARQKPSERRRFRLLVPELLPVRSLSRAVPADRLAKSQQQIDPPPSEQASRRSKTPRGMEILTQILGRHAPARLSPGKRGLFFVYTLLWTSLSVVTFVSALGAILGLLNSVPTPRIPVARQNAPAAISPKHSVVEQVPALRRKRTPYPDPNDFDDSDEVRPASYEFIGRFQSSTNAGETQAAASTPSYEEP